MKTSIITIFIAFSIFGCSNKKENELPFTFKNQIKNFILNDTVYFKSNLNDLDTIVLRSHDSVFGKNNGFTTLAYKKLMIRIEYLPLNKWHDGILMSNKKKKYDSIKNHSFVWIFEDYQEDKPLFEMGINYRDFEGKINFENLDSKEIDTIINSNYLRDSLNADSVLEIYWSKYKGLLGYKKKDGQIYFKCFKK